MRLVISAAILILSALPALAETNCSEPVAPALLDGGAASAEQLRAAMAEARNFMAQSEVYQDCVLQEAQAARSDAVAAGQLPDPAAEASARAKIAASKRMEERAGTAINLAVIAYKKKN